MIQLTESHKNKRVTITSMMTLFILYLREEDNEA